MIVTKKYINDLRQKLFINISKEKEDIILEKFGRNAVVNDDHEYTEQDIYEQIRKML